MKNIALKLQEDIFTETEKVLESTSMSRNKYINEAIRFYNSYQKRKRLKDRLSYESKLVGAHSMSVLEEFEELYGTD